MKFERVEDLKEYQDLFTGRKKDKTAMDSISKRLTEQRLALMETEPFGEYSLSRLSEIASMLSYGKIGDTSCPSNIPTNVLWSYCSIIHQSV